MIKKLSIIALSVVILSMTSCASILSESSYPITINSTPSEAVIVVTDKKGVEVFRGQTPSTINLKSGSGFFGKAHYQVKFMKDGYNSKTVPVKFKLDGWYFGNILVGGVIGLLIIDPATGAMYKLDTEFLNETLMKKDTTSSIDKEEFKVYTLNNIPTQWKEHLVKIDNY